MDRDTHGIFSPKENRPIDERIPKEWRDKFVDFTGVQPTYDEYLSSPDVWDYVHDDAQTQRIFRWLAIVIVAVVIVSFILSFIL